MDPANNMEIGSKSFYSYQQDPSKGHVDVGREKIHESIRPHESYEGGHRFDPGATWTAEEERRLVRKTDLRLLSWLCVMVKILPECFPCSITKLM